MIARAAIAALLLACAAATSAVDPVSPNGETAAGMSALDLRLKRLEAELRCLVCQNQTLADSNADLADDLRREVRSLALAGKSDDDIKAYLVARYGDFVLYKPPVKPTRGRRRPMVGGVAAPRAQHNADCDEGGHRWRDARTQAAERQGRRRGVGA